MSVWLRMRGRSSSFECWKNTCVLEHGILGLLPPPTQTEFEDGSLEIRETHPQLINSLPNPADMQLIINKFAGRNPGMPPPVVSQSLIIKLHGNSGDGPHQWKGSRGVHGLLTMGGTRGSETRARVYPPYLKLVKTNIRRVSPDHRAPARTSVRSAEEIQRDLANRNRASSVSIGAANPMFNTLKNTPGGVRSCRTVSRSCSKKWRRLEVSELASQVTTVVTEDDSNALADNLYKKIPGELPPGELAALRTELEVATDRVVCAGDFLKKDRPAAHATSTDPASDGWKLPDEYDVPPGTIIPAEDVFQISCADPQHRWGNSCVWMSPSLGCCLHHMETHHGWNGISPLYIALFDTAVHTNNIQFSPLKESNGLPHGLEMYARYSEGLYITPTAWYKYDPETKQMQRHHV